MWSEKVKILLVIGITLMSVVAVLMMERIPQDLNYHNFADKRTILGIPNMWDVLSNIPFVLFGGIGLASLMGKNLVFSEAIYRTIAWLFFAGLTLTGVGSIYYHLDPTNQTLVWDRLPMTISFMAIFNLVIALHIDAKIAKQCLWLLLLVGVFSVCYWYFTERIGMGDLRLYGLVQFLPMVLIPIIVSLFRTDRYKQRWIWVTAAIYISAKLAEHFDYQIYAALGLSGHSWKHIIAAFSGLSVLAVLKSIKRPISELNARQ